MAEEAIILKIQLDPANEIKKLEELTLELEQNRAAQKELTKARQEQKLTDAEYSKRQVELTADIKRNQTELRVGAKNLEAYQQSTQLAEGSVVQLRAQLAANTAAFHNLSKAERENSEAGKLLREDTERISKELSVAEQSIGDFRRNVGRYADGFKGALEPLVQELVKLQEKEKELAEGSKELAEGSKELAENQQRQIGFMTAAQQAAAKQGKTYAEATKEIENYAKSIRPTVRELVKLEQEQGRLVESGEQATEAFQKIGFQIQATQKQIADVPAETKKVGESIEELDKVTGAFGGNVGSLKEKFGQAKQGIELARLGFTGLKGAIAATGIGLFILALGALYTYLTRTQEGMDFVERKTKGLTTVLGVLVDKIAPVGKALLQVFTEPKQAAADLAEFIGTNLLNRVKAFGVLWDGARSGDMSKIGDSVVQFTSGITDASAKAKSFQNELAGAFEAGEKVAGVMQTIRDQEGQIEKRQKQNEATIERLKFIAEDTTKATRERVAAAQQAFALEKETLSASLALQERKVQALKDEAAQHTQTAAQQRELADEEGRLADLEKNSLTRQIELNNKINEIRKSASDAEKAASAAAAEKRAEAQREALKLEQLRINKELLAVKEGTNEELNLRQRKLKTGYELELAQAKLTVGARKVIEEKYQQESEALLRETAKKREVANLQNAQSALTAELAALREGGAQELRVQQELLQLQLAQQLAALDQRNDNSKKERELRAQNAKAIGDLEYNAALRGLEDELSARRALINQSYAEGQLTKQQQEDALLAIERAGAQARLVTQQDYGKSTVAIAEQIAQQLAAGRDKDQSDAQARLEKNRAIDQARIASASEITNGIITLFGEENAAGEAALALKKVLALSEIAINLNRELSAIAVTAANNPLNIPTAGLAGVSQAAIYTGIAVAKAALLTAAVLAFRDGGLAYDPAGHIADGPSHAQGGIPLYSRRTGRAVGIEIEGGEPVLTTGVSRNPALLAAASAINVAGGGRPLVPGLPVLPSFGAGGVGNDAYTRQALRGNVPSIDYAQLGREVAGALRANPPINRWEDFQDAARQANRTADRSGA